MNRRGMLAAVLAAVVAPVAAARERLGIWTPVARAPGDGGAVSILDYMRPWQRAAHARGVTVLDAGSALQAAANDGRKVYLPAGSYWIGNFDSLVWERHRAKKAGDTAKAEEIRSALEANGVEIKDFSDGTMWQCKEPYLGAGCFLELNVAKGTLAADTLSISGLPFKTGWQGQRVVHIPAGRYLLNGGASHITE